MKLTSTVAGEPVTIHALPGPEDADAFAVFLASDSVLGLDVETSALEDAGAFAEGSRTRLVQLGSETEAWVLDPRTDHGRSWLSVAFSGSTRYVSHTGLDPLVVRREFDVWLDDRWIDTLTMSRILDPGMRKGHDLKARSVEYIDGGLVAAQDALYARFAELAPKIPTKVKKDGTMGYRPMMGGTLHEWGWNNIPTDDPAYLLYAGLDAIYVRRLLDVLSARFRFLPGMAKLSKDEQELRRICTDLQYRGLLLDVEYTQRVLADIERDYDAAVQRLEETFDFPAGSPKRAGWLEARGVVFEEYTDKGNAKLDKETIPKLAHKYSDDPVVGPVLEDMLVRSQKSNMRSNLNSLLSHRDKHNLLHPEVKTVAAVTGRQSITGPAMQTFAKDKEGKVGPRGCFIAHPGYVLVSADYDSQEIRLAAAYSKDPALLAVVLEGKNQHDLTAEGIFGKGFTSEQRATAKMINLAANYGAGAKTIGERLKIGKEGGRELWLEWRNTYREFVMWSEMLAAAMSGHQGSRKLERIRDSFGLSDSELMGRWDAWRNGNAQYVEDGAVVNPWGRRVPVDTGFEYKAGNALIQSTGRELLGDAIRKLATVGLAEYVWLPIHDELVLEVPEAMAQVAGEALEWAMSSVFLDVPITTTAEIVGHRWGGEASPVLVNAA